MLTNIVYSIVVQYQKKIEDYPITAILTAIAATITANIISGSS